MADNCAEGPIVTEMLRLLQMPFVSRQVESRQDLERDASIYRQRTFDVLLFSAHGGPGEIGLTTGERVPVGELLSLFRGPSSTAVLFSSCEVLSGDALPAALANDGTPDYVLGYTAKVHWSTAALASVMLMHGLAQNEFGRLLSTLVAIRDCAGVSICGYMRTVESDTHQWFSTDEFIQHAKEASGATNAVQLSAVIASYMQEERERFQARTDEYLCQMKEMEAENAAGAERHRAAGESRQHLDRPSKPEGDP